MPRSRGLVGPAGPLAVLFVLVASISPSATSHEGGFCVEPVSLKAKAEKKVAALEAKFSKNEVKTSALAADLTDAEADLVDAEAALAAAEALPEGTPEEKKAKKKAVAAAEEEVGKLEKRIAKLGKKIAKKEKKHVSLVTKILKVDPSRFFTFEPEPEGPSPFDPPWADVAPTTVIGFEHDDSLSNAQNGELLRQTILGLSPGDRLEIGDGTYSISNHFTAPLVGTSTAPIFVVAAEGASPRITRPNAYENVMNVGTTTPGSAQYLAFRGLEFEGGSMGIRIYGGSNVWIDRCEIHHTEDAGLTANTVDTDHLYLTRNHIHHTSGYGEGMYLGANGGAVTMRDSIVARNHIHDTGSTGGQGDGIEVKQGSHSNWIVENCIHDTHYPCLIAYGTFGNPVNVIERNVLIGSDDNTLQVQGEAIVRNNLIIDGAVGFYSHDHQDQTKDLQFVHNTILNSKIATTMKSWFNRTGMVFANNVVYSENAASIVFVGGAAGVTVTGNVVHGLPYLTPVDGYTVGEGLGDFFHASWDGDRFIVRPREGSAIVGAAAAEWAVAEDVTGASRAGPLAAGCAQPLPSDDAE